MRSIPSLFPVLPIILALSLVHAKVHAAMTVSITPSSYNGYHISCNGGTDGSLNVTVTGGTAPFTFVWNNTVDNIEDQTGLSAGYYRVSVTDSYSNNAVAEFTLLEPGPIDLSLVPYSYPNSYNVSCYSCFNGSIATTVTGGASPFTFDWNDGGTTEDRTSLGTGNYYFELTDANGCVANSGVVYLTEPERSDWTMTGNAGSTPGTHYLGTSDNKDFVFKTNGSERWRLLSSGSIKAIGLAEPSKYTTLFADSNGVLKNWGTLNAELADYITDPSKPGCPMYSAVPWTLCGNTIASDNFLGTLNDQPLVIKTDGVTRMVVGKYGRVGINTYPPALGTPPSIYQLYVEGGILARDVKVTVNTFYDHVFAPSYRLMTLAELRAYLVEHRHLPGIPSESEIRAAEGVELGEFQMKMLKVVEEQALYILQLEDKLHKLEARMLELETGQQ